MAVLIDVGHLRGYVNWY